MDAPLYDIYLTGKLAGGVTQDQASARLAQLFKSTPEAMAGLLTGKPQVLKRGVDKATALKYREALGRAGVEVAFKEVAGKETVAATPSPAPAAPPPESNSADGLTLAPPGADVLTDAERQHIPAVAVDVSHLSVAPPGDLSAGITRVAVTAPDTGHLTLAAAGSDLLSAAEREHPPVAAPDISELSLAPAGTPLETLHDAAPLLNPDTSGLSLAPAGSDLLTPEQRNKPAPPPPQTDHLRVVDGG